MRAHGSGRIQTTIERVSAYFGPRASNRSFGSTLITGARTHASAASNRVVSDHKADVRLASTASKLSPPGHKVHAWKKRAWTTCGSPSLDPTA